MKREMFSEVDKNKRDSILIMLLFIIIFIALGIVLGAIWGSIPFGGIVAAIFAIVYTIIMFNSGDKTILSVTGARKANKAEHAYLVNTVEGVAIAAGLPKTPEIYVIEDNSLNAFATGKDPNHASVAVTTGLMAKLNRQELEGVIAHEIAHVRNYDIRVMMIAAVFVGVVALLSDLILRSMIFGGGRRREGNGQIILILVGVVFAILAPLAVHLIKLAISRKREYAADASGAIFTRYPEGLASALEKIKSDSNPPLKNANRATAHLFISNPLKGKKKSSIWSTHPDIDSRIKRLREM